MHWINSEMLAISDIPKIRKPLIWTLHDMWAFCGAEHVSHDTRHIRGYSKSNRPSHEGRLDVNRWTWKRKAKHWTTPFQIVAVSRWLAEQARASALFRDWPIKTINNPIDTDKWTPMHRTLARQELGIPRTAFTICFGATNPNDPNKGLDLLIDSLWLLKSRLKDNQPDSVRLLVFGKNRISTGKTLPFPTIEFGEITNAKKLVTIYNASSVTATPSRIEAFGQTAAESLACGTPVVSFSSSGLKDIIDHKLNGYLASAFDVDDLAEGFHWIHRHKNPELLSSNARMKAEERFSFRIIGKQYAALYEEIAHNYQTNAYCPPTTIDQ